MLTVETRASKTALHELAAVVSQEADELSPAAFEHIVSRHPGLAASDARDVALAAVRADIAAFAEVLGHDVPPTEWDAPLMALVHTRRLARAGVGLDGILRIYRLGQEWLFGRICVIARELQDDPEAATELIEHAGAILFQLVDSVCVSVAKEFESERETLLRRALERREAVVESILAGEPVDHQAAERALSYRFDRFNVSFVCWAPERPGEAHSHVPAHAAAKALATALGCERPLIVADRDGSAAAWVSLADPPAIDHNALEAVLRNQATNVKAAVGTPRKGLDGFRESRRDADRARQVACVSSRDRSCVFFDEIALVALLAADREAAQRFVTEQLGELSCDDAASETLRRTVLEVFQAAGSHKAAGYALHIHRNTVAHRLARAEASLGRPLDERRRELEAALLLAHWLGHRVLTECPGTPDQPAQTA